MINYMIITCKKTNEHAPITKLSVLALGVGQRNANTPRA